MQIVNQRHGYQQNNLKNHQTIKWKDGQTYPLVKLHITSASHPYYTGQEKLIDIEGRVDKFKNRQDAAKAAQAKLQAKTLKSLRKQERVVDSPAPTASLASQLATTTKTASPKRKKSVSAAEEPSVTSNTADQAPETRSQ